MGRFISPDTVVQDPADIKSFDRFAYVNNNPIKNNDPSGNRACDGSYDCGKKEKPAAENVNLSEDGKKMYQYYVKFLTEKGWWNKKGEVVLTVQQFLGMWILFERAGEKAVENDMKDAVRNQLWMDDKRSLSRDTYCKQYCSNGAFNFMAAYAGHHNDTRFNGASPILDYEGSEKTTDDLVDLSGTLGDVLTYDPTFDTSYKDNVSFGWGNKADNYEKIKNVTKGYEDDQIVNRIPENFYIFTIGQYKKHGFGTFQ